MDNNYIIRKLLNESEIVEITRLLNSTDSKWIDGRITNNISEKNNLELDTNSQTYKMINPIIMSALDRDELFFEFSCPKKSGSCIVAKYPSGSYYNVHTDSYETGDISTTVFLSDPNEYSGGELCLFLDYKEIKFKPPIGYAISYSTGITHRINKVTKGTRIASVLWTHSRIRDKQNLSLYRKIFRLTKILNGHFNWEDFDMTTCEKSINNPLFLIDDLENEFLRRFGD